MKFSFGGNRRITSAFITSNPIASMRFPPGQKNPCGLSTGSAYLIKARGLGGRLCARGTPSGTFDHGAPYLTAKSEWVFNPYRLAPRCGRLPFEGILFSSSRCDASRSDCFRSPSMGSCSRPKAMADGWFMGSTIKNRDLRRLVLRIKNRRCFSKRIPSGRQVLSLLPVAGRYANFPKSFG